MRLEPVVELVGVHKSFGAAVALAGVDLRVPAGTLCGFIGPNGSGKTTAMRLILRILLPSSGTVRVFGLERGAAADERIGYLPEERGLYRRMRIRDLLCFHARLKGTRDPRAAADRWLERFGLRERAGARALTLSRGLSQKLQLAVALVHDPELLILDEPFSGLDPVSTDELSELVRELRGRGTTVILSTHNMTTAEQLCDHVVMLHRGRKVLDGSLDAVRSSADSSWVKVRFAGAPPSLDNIRGIVGSSCNGQQWMLRLAPGAELRQLAADLLALGELIHFEVGSPTLHEVFVGVARSTADETGVEGDPT